MTGPADFLARWSRRKRDAARPAPVADSIPAAEPVLESEPVVDLASLPAIEDIVAGTDIRAFLQKGVPADLTRAALRRAWETDPAIRSYVGLADYDWDFHTPGALAGFGPLQPGDDVAKMVADVFRDLASDNHSQIDAPPPPRETESAVAAAPELPPAAPDPPQSTTRAPDQLPVTLPGIPPKRRHGGALPT